MAADLHGQAVELLLARGQNEEALALCEKGLKAAPSPRAYMRRAELQASLGYKREVRDSVLSAAKLEPGSLELRVRAADLLEGIGEYAAAAEQLDAALALDAASAPALRRRAKLHLWRADGEPAAALAERVLTRDPKDREALRIRGGARVLLGDKRARADLDAVIAADGRDCEAFCWRGELNRLEGALDASMADFRRAREIWPYPMAALVNMELIHVLRREPIPPVEHDLLFTRIPKEIFGWTGDRATSYDPEQAERQLKGVLAQMGGNRSLKSTFVRGEGESRRIIDHLHFFPRDGLMNLQATVRFGSYQRVISLLGEIIAENPDEAYPYSHRGEVLLWSGRYRDALADFSKARGLNDYLLWPKVGLGASHLLLDELPQAEELIEFAARSATDSIISTWRGELFRKLGRHERAVQELDKIKEPLPFRPAVWLNKGLSLAALGRVDEAAGILARLKKHAPEFVSDAESAAKSSEAPAVLGAALALMRGCRSSWMYCYVKDERVKIIKLRDVPQDAVPPILRGYPWAFA